MSTEEPLLPRTGTIRNVEGRGSPGSPKGLPPAARMTIEGAFGSKRLSLPTPKGVKVPGRVRVVVDGGRFTGCPICLSPEADSAEHVPPLPLGGKVMTWTCKRCNNGFGSRVEKALADYYTRTLDVRVSSDLLPGNRKLQRFYLRVSEEGDPVFLQGRGRADSEVEALFHQIMESGTAQFTLAGPDPQAVRVAALKSAYLAACLAIRDVPLDGFAAEVRTELLKARDTPRREPLALGPHAQRLGLAITGMDPIPHSITIVDWKKPDGQTLTQILLGGTISVGWPLEDELLEVALKVGAQRVRDIEDARRRKLAEDSAAD